MWAKNDGFSKWHLVKSIEDYEDRKWIWQEKKFVAYPAKKVTTDCGYILTNVKFRDSVSIFQANVCAYCKKRAFKDIDMGLRS